VLEMALFYMTERYNEKLLWEMRFDTMTGYSKVMTSFTQSDNQSMSYICQSLTILSSLLAQFFLQLIATKFNLLYLALLILIIFQNIAIKMARLTISHWLKVLVRLGLILISELVIPSPKLIIRVIIHRR
jgi:hypothetical protein